MYCVATLLTRRFFGIILSGVGLAFVVYPEALNHMFVPQLWSVLFFIMLFTLGIGSSVALTETILTCIRDEFTSLRKKKWILALIACTSFCVLGLPLTTDVCQIKCFLSNNPIIDF
jgi:solute carrier family 6 amino acid transporter-like protein 5/7/9/14